MQVFLLWLSINISAVDVTLGMLAPTVFALGFRDAALCAVFGSILGGVPVAYIATWGPLSGNRTLVSVSGWKKEKDKVSYGGILMLVYVGLCQIHHGVVAEPIGRLAESDNTARLFFD